MAPKDIVKLLKQEAIYKIIRHNLNLNWVSACTKFLSSSYNSSRERLVILALLDELGWYYGNYPNQANMLDVVNKTSIFLGNFQYYLSNLPQVVQETLPTPSGLGRSIPHLSIFGNIAPFYVRLLTSSIYISQRRTRSMSVSRGQSVIWCQKCTTRPSEIFHDEGYYCTRCWNVIKEPRS